jgi:hypothetical protein
MNLLALMLLAQQASAAGHDSCALWLSAMSIVCSGASARPLTAGENQCKSWVLTAVHACMHLKPILRCLRRTLQRHQRLRGTVWPFCVRPCLHLNAALLCCRVPQLADCTDVMQQIKRRKGTRYTCLTPNLKVCFGGWVSLRQSLGTAWSPDHQNRAPQVHLQDWCTQRGMCFRQLSQPPDAV